MPSSTRSVAPEENGTEAPTFAKIDSEEDNIKIFGMTESEHRQRETDSGESVEVSERPKWVINPTSTFMKKWDIFQAFILFYLSITVPIRVGFGVKATGFGYLLDLFVDLYFWLDIAVNFRKGFEDASGIVIYDTERIRKNYMATWFSLDLVASLPVDLAFRLGENEFVCSIESFGENLCPQVNHTAVGFTEAGRSEGQLFRLFKLFRLVRLVKMLRLIRLQRLLERYQDELFDLMPTIKMCKLVFILVLLGHIFGCFFYFFSTKDYRLDSETEDMIQGKYTTWMHSEFGQGIEDEQSYYESEQKIENTMLGQRYIASMYWAFTTMTTVGYGDISAITMSERTFAMVGMLVGGFAFSAMISSIATVFESRDLSKQAANRRIDLVSAFVRDRTMGKVLRMQVLSFFRKQQVVAYDEREFLHQMPYQIRSEVLRHCYGDIVQSVPMFQGASDVFITEVLFCLEPKIFVAGVMITQKGEVGTDMYILENGDVEILEDDQKSVVRVLPAGSYFGEEICLGIIKRQMNVKAKANSRICCLARSDLDPLLDQWPLIRESIQMWYYKRMEHFGQKLETTKNSDSDDVATMARNSKGNMGDKFPVTHVPQRSPSTGLVIDRVAHLEADMKCMTSKLDNLTALMTTIDSKLTLHLQSQDTPTSNNGSEVS